MKRWFVILIVSLFLVACSEQGKSELEQEVQNSSVGFKMAGESVEEAPDVPVDQKKQILNAFHEYIEAFNEKDIARYEATLSKDPKGFNLEEDKQATAEIFEIYDIERKAADVSVVKYVKDEAHVYANLEITTTEIATGSQLQSRGRQVTVFVEEKQQWKVSSIYYIGDSK